MKEQEAVNLKHMKFARNVLIRHLKSLLNHLLLCFFLYNIQNMPLRKRTVKYTEDTDATGDKNVEVSEEQSVDTEQQSNQQTESEDERYTASAG